MIQAGIVIGIGDEERDCGQFGFVALPRVGDNLLIRLDGGLIPLRVAEVYHHPAPGGSDEAPAAVLRVEHR